MNEEQIKDTFNPLEVVNITAQQAQTFLTDKLAAALAKFHEALSKTDINKDQSKEIFYKDKNDQWQKRLLKYASLDNILKVTRPLLAKQGLTIIQALTGENLTTILIHSSGQQIQFLTPFAPMKGKGTNEVQNIGGGLTYLRRYTYNSILGLSIEDDTDGDEETKKPPKNNLKPIKEQHYQAAANSFLKYGTLDKYKEKFNIPEKDAVKIYFKAKEIKETIEQKQKNKEAAAAQDKKPEATEEKEKVLV